MKIDDFFANYDNVVIAVSGGVDSIVLMNLAVKYACNVYPVFVKTQLQPDFELEAAKKYCDSLNLDLKVIDFDILSEQNIVKNDSLRCYYCKRKMFNLIIAYASSLNINTIFEGTNFSDNVDDRPGYIAIQELGVLSPLRLCEMDKKSVRDIAKKMGLEIHNKPSYSCLATRIVNQELSNDLLSKVQLAENYLFKMGFSDFRVRSIESYCMLELTNTDKEKYLYNKIIIDKALMKYYNCVKLSLKER